jgi:serine/threonine protein kinase
MLGLRYWGRVMTTAAARIEDTGEEHFADELKPGTQLLLGQFTIESFLNSGGFGITYLARDSLDRRVVIKECFPSSFCRRNDNIVGPRTRQRNEEFRSIVKLFLQEAYNLSQLDHPYIVKVHQVFEDNETAYMAMDYIQGPDLLETVEGKVPRLQPPQIVTLLRKMLEAIGYVHDQGMLHRDISPDNILLDKFTGNPILIDFGASKKDVTRKSRALSGLRVVKDGYSPQEFYIAGSKQAPCSDLYALAASFYHLIADDTPKTSQDRLSSIANREPDPHRPLAGRFPAYPATFLQAIDKAMAIFPRDRLQSVAEWQAMLRDLQDMAVAEAPNRRAAVESGAPTVPAAPPRPVQAAVEANPSEAALLASLAAGPVAATVTPPVAQISEVQRAAPVPVAATRSQPERTSRDILMSSAAAILLLSGLLSLPNDLIDQLRGTVAVAPVVAEAAPPAVAAPRVDGPFAMSRTVRLPYVADTNEPSRVAGLLPGSPGWMQPGQRIVEVNGQPVQSDATMGDLLAASADLSNVTRLNAIIGYEAAPGADIVRKMESLPVVWELRLPNGLSFDIVETPTGTQTVVASVPAGVDTDLQPGDVLLVFTGTGETVGTATALSDILQRETANGVATYRFAVQRKTNTMDATFRLKGDA